MHKTLMMLICVMEKILRFLNLKLDRNRKIKRFEETYNERTYGISASL
jgi:hypothetical protein